MFNVFIIDLWQSFWEGCITSAFGISVVLAVVIPFLFGVQDRMHDLTEYIPYYWPFRYFVKTCFKHLTLNVNRKEVVQRQLKRKDLFVKWEITKCFEMAPYVEARSGPRFTVILKFKDHLEFKVKNFTPGKLYLNHVETAFFFLMFIELLCQGKIEQIFL